MDRIKSMSILLDVVEAGSLSAASRHLGIPLSTVSRRVSELETHLNARLLNRSTRQLALTDAGRPYAAACKRILDEMQEAERAVSGEYSKPRGELIVTAPMVFGRLHVLPLVAGFLEAYAEVDIRLRLADGLLNLMEDHIDLAIRIGHLPDSGLIAARLGAVRRVVCGSPDYFAARGTPEIPDDLKVHDCVTFGGQASPGAWTFTAPKGEVSVPIRSRLSVNTAEAAIDAAVAGVGVTRVLSYQVAGALRDGSLAVALQKFEPEPMPVSLVHNGQDPQPLKLRAFLDFVAPRLREILRQ